MAPARQDRDGRPGARLVRHGGRRCVLKVLGPARDGAARRAHEDLVARLRDLQHPALASVLAGGVGRPGAPAARWLLTAWVAGRTAREAVEDGGLAPEPVRAVLHDLARGLAALHAAGLVHRDVAPGNVVLREGGGAVLIDFGQAVRARADGAASAGIVGTPGYVAPEEVTGAAGARAPAVDVYGWGAVGHALLVGRPPASGEDVLDALAAATRPPPRPGDLGVEVPRDLEDLLQETLAPDPSLRPDASTLAARTAAPERGRPSRGEAT